MKILDFGSVKDKAENAKKLTVIGTTIGSPFYMAPEQAQGLETLDHRADVWALAAITYECLTGQVPFKGNSGPAILLEILTKNPRPPSELSPKGHFPIAPGLDAVMARAFQKAPITEYSPSVNWRTKLAWPMDLTETHKQWAARTQQDLEAVIVANLPQLMGQTTARDQVADSFFGGANDLGDWSEPSLLADAPNVAPQLQKVSASSAPPLAIPTARWPIVAVIVAAAMLAVMAVVLLFVL